MKTETEKELEREIENWKEKTDIDKYYLKDVDKSLVELKVSKAKLSGYRLAKEEFNKKVDKLIENIKIKFGDNPMKPVKIILKEIDKLAKEFKEKLK